MASNNEVPCGCGSKGEKKDSDRPKKDKKKPEKQNKILLCDSRKLWLEHVFWTREVAALTLLKVEGKVVQPSLDRLYKNQVDLGTWFATLTDDKKVGQTVTALLNTHIDQAVQIVTNIANDGPADELKGYQEAWKQNALEIANTLREVAKKYHFKWSREDLKSFMLEHLATTTNEVVQFKAGNYQGAVEAFDEVEKHIVKFSDFLLGGSSAKGR